MFSKKATKIDKIFTTDLTVATYRHSLIYVVNVGTQGKKRGSNNRVNRGDLVVLKERKIRCNSLVKPKSLKLKSRKSRHVKLTVTILSIFVAFLENLVV